MTKISTAEARNGFAEVINRASFGKERFVLTRRGKQLVAIVPVEDLELLEELEDRMDIEAAKAALAESDERISYEDLRRELGLK
ncbi:type II toxin-antitoxin system prevent-host-death family antitoxin [Geotalea sp. SG265]|uniref:type II toxin-antitoxin system Phd/YefM family antitoxin n=1 Tax=Geotalea sp. SG265 TaxID=2922867 RepID=UPI001FAF63E5|nr:type II toxin-antitoxin system prevent-host-death family antitoxin [Geotalea sp. SG265]